MLIISLSDTEGSVTTNKKSEKLSATTSIQWSTDGQSWFDASSGGFRNYTGNGVAYGNGKWVAVGYGSTPESSIQWSSDGQVWQDATSGGFNGVYSGKTGYGVAYGNNMWVAVGNGASKTNSIQWSTDGQTWNDASSGGFYFHSEVNLYQGYGIAYANEKWVAVGYGSSPESTILWSTDGKIWQDASSGGFDGIYNKKGNGVASTRLLPNSYTPSPQPPCFVAGTQIFTPTGYKNIEDIQSGEYIVTADTRRVRVNVYSFTIQVTAETAPFRIAANALGPGKPQRDLCVSPRHAIKDTKGRWQIPKYLAYQNKKIKQYGVGESVTYYHIECPNFYKDNLIAEGIEVESYKNKQGISGVVYMWSDALLGWERVQNMAMPKTLTTHVIYSALA